jgi:hypothetical protein
MRKTVVNKNDNMKKTNMRKTANKIINANETTSTNLSGTAYLHNDKDKDNKANENQKPLFYVTGRSGENMIPNPYSHNRTNSNQRKIDRTENNNNLIMRKTSNKINKDDETKMKARLTKNRITKFIRKTINNNNNNKESDESDEDKELFGLNNAKKKNN